MVPCCLLGSGRYITLGRKSSTKKKIEKSNAAGEEKEIKPRRLSCEPCHHHKVTEVAGRPFALCASRYGRLCWMYGCQDQEKKGRALLCNI